MVDAAWWDAQADTAESARLAAWGDPGWTEGERLMRRAVITWLTRSMRRPRDVLVDLGCGPGRMSIPLAAAWPESTIVAVDVAERMLLRGAETHERSGGRGSIVWHLGDGRALPAVPQVIDGGWSVLTFQHLPGDVMAGYLASVGARLGEGGAFVFQFVEGTGAGDGPHSFEHRLADVRGWLAAAGLNLLVARTAILPQWMWVVAGK